MYLKIINLSLFVIFVNFFNLSLCEDKHFTIIIPSYNNENFCEQNLSSVFNQNYTNYDVIYIDDCSTDGTVLKVKSIIEKHSLADRFLLIKNRGREYKLHNLFIAIQGVDDKNVIVILDGDDCFTDRDVLRHLNDNVYSDPFVWMGYSGFVDNRNNETIIPSAYSEDCIKNGLFRDNPHYYATGCLSFYAWLFKKIKIKDLLNEDMFLDVCSDIAIFYPIIEMARDRHTVIKKPLIYYNRQNPINDFKVNSYRQTELGAKLRKNYRYYSLHE